MNNIAKKILNHFCTLRQQFISPEFLRQKYKISAVEKNLFSIDICSDNFFFIKTFWNHYATNTNMLKARCHTRFQGSVTACVYVFKEITLVGSNQRNYFENANARG